MYDSALGEVQEQNVAYGRMNPLIQVPVISVENMLKFNPALEDIKNFIWRNYDKVTSMHNLDDSMKHDNVFSIVVIFLTVTKVAFITFYIMCNTWTNNLIF